ncbi:unnamed protein product [Aphis gossypii]|uniref:Uncharacterized protein n=1 Tax=Aphis gossypii TaxID=80765 RepID=A0A9P0J7P9_APHGO|nr:unnamed protein product [Aphis gossypii]
MKEATLQVAKITTYAKHLAYLLWVIICVQYLWNNNAITGPNIMLN